MSVLVRPRPPHPGGVYRIPGEDALAKARASRTPGNLLRVSRSASAGGSTFPLVKWLTTDRATLQVSPRSSSLRLLRQAGAVLVSG